MVILQDFYNVGDTQFFSKSFYKIIWLAQTFTASANYKISSVKLKLFRFDTAGGSGSAGTITVNIKAGVLGTGPIGPVLATGSIDGSSIVYSAVVAPVEGAWYEITFGTPVNLTKGNVYAIEVSAPNSDDVTLMYWKTDVSFATYMGGSQCRSVDGGFAWSCALTWDSMFEAWGIPVNALGWPYLPDLPADRPDAYDPDQFWLPGEWVGDVYTDPKWGEPGDSKYFATGGGRWGQQLVAVGHSAVYFEELT